MPQNNFIIKVAVLGAFAVLAIWLGNLVIPDENDELKAFVGGIVSGAGLLSLEGFLGDEDRNNQVAERNAAFRLQQPHV